MNSTQTPTLTPRAREIGERIIASGKSLRVKITMDRHGCVDIEEINPDGRVDFVDGGQTTPEPNFIDE